MSVNRVLLQSAADVDRLRGLIKRLAQPPTIIDFEELMLQPAVRARTSLWEQNRQIAAFACVDDYNNLWFEIDPGNTSLQLEKEIIDWGMACIKQLHAVGEEENALDTSCEAGDLLRIILLKRHGFEQGDIRSLHYRRTIDQSIPEPVFPPGFTVRCVTGEQEVDLLVDLHREAFGTSHMTRDQRLAIMRAPGYDPTMDFVALNPGGKMCAFCICSVEGDDHDTGHIDPIGTREEYKRMGLGQAIVSVGLRALQDRGARFALFGTSSENEAMQRLANKMGFVVVSERVWFSKKP
jgi:mycothiol synthase